MLHAEKCFPSPTCFCSSECTPEEACPEPIFGFLGSGHGPLTRRYPRNLSESRTPSCPMLRFSRKARAHGNVFPPFPAFGAFM